MSRMKSTYWILGLIAVALGIYLLFTSSDTVSVEPPFEAGIMHPIDHVKGNASSSVVIMEYSDFQCPACRSYYPIIRELIAEFGDRAAFIYRHFPLINIHGNAEFAARAAEAAGRQGKFWEMHDLLFEKQNEWAPVADATPSFESYALLLGISVPQFKTDFASEEVKNLVITQRVHAIKSGLAGTPSFFLNGKQIQNPVSVLEFRNLINKALNPQGS